jgi:hypothetical protein
VLLTNLPKRELPVPAVNAGRLPEVPLIVPAPGGVITDFLRRWLNLLWQAFADEVASGNPYQL